VHGGPLLGRTIGLVRGERVLREDRFAYVDLVEASSGRSGS
jgi:hypothetical protein